ncbi:COX5B-domain-containing protein [Metschnikowia bicuspidata var. bicuspidata NRRL YB-4993]|uniref:COX5B-domain-containing protein n=1 Tax=Metschnikowia bicuspidata var. bicuspidata NRRL YB-4993 TaxID=869754 RepID=A0A1A0HG54_9ASCO|nr:COX5B-domain-containing protein [Metschnikowia bicuspidata var. bicuspidata NRRL YB-4993]OBA23144.1 COX5B-domain-containing protein [Metschnikowia bicuspidata var. bicuspidata NRRL YB-4993]
MELCGGSFKNVAKYRRQAKKTSALRPAVYRANVYFLYYNGLLSSILRRDLLVLSESLSLRRSSDSSVDSGSDSHDSGVDGTRNTVVQLVVQLWQSVLLVHRSLGQVSDGSSLNHVSDGDSLDGLVLWHTSGTVQTSDWLDVASTLLVSSVGSSLLWHVAGMLSRTIARVARQSRTLSSSRIVFSATKLESKTATKLADVTGPDSSLIGAGATPGTIPTDIDQATGLERFEILGKMEGVDVFDMENPIFEGKGTMKDPYMVPTYIGYRYVGCRGHDTQDHKPYWMKVEEGNPGRCWQCGSVYAAKYVGEPGHHHH